MIWHLEVERHEKPIPHVLYSDIERLSPDDLLLDFNIWISGQTVLRIDDETDFGVYQSDFDRWVEYTFGTDESTILIDTVGDLALTLLEDMARWIEGMSEGGTDSTDLLNRFSELKKL